MNKYKFNGYDIWFTKSFYAYGGSLAILSHCSEGPYATFTVCLEDEPEDQECAFIDTNNLGNGVCSFLEDNKIAFPTGRYGDSGYCTYPEYRFDKKFLENCDTRGYF